MAHYTHRRNLAALDHPKPSMDPTHKKHPTTTSSSSSITKPHHHHHPHPDPTSPPSTIQNISSHFSKLYTNHKILTTLKSSTHQPSNTSCTTTLTKSKSQHNPRETTKTMVKEKLVKVKPPFEVPDIDKLFVKQIIKKPLSSKTKEFSYEDVEKKKEPSSESGDEIKKPSFSLAVNDGGRRRKSFCSSQTELADFLSCAGVKVVSVDMPPFMQIHAVDCARKTYDSLEKFTARTLASTLKKEFDGVYGPAWHCIVGTSFGSFVTHSVGGFMYFSMDHKLYLLLFKTTVQKAD